MSRQRVIQAFEYQVLRYDSQGLFRKHHFEAMVQFNEKHGNKYYTVVHKGVRFDSYVGVLQVGGLTIEILPKADNNPHADMHLWQGVLLDMLYMCHKIRVDHQSEAALRRRHNSILDIYFELFLNETEEIVKRGLIRKSCNMESCSMRCFRHVGKIHVGCDVFLARMCQGIRVRTMLVMAH